MMTPDPRPTTPADRWEECDGEPDPIKRIECRTSRLNDHAHATDRRLRRMARRLDAALLCGALAGAGGVAKLLETAHALGWLP